MSCQLRCHLFLEGITWDCYKVHYLQMPIMFEEGNRPIHNKNKKCHFVIWITINIVSSGANTYDCTIVLHVHLNWKYGIICKGSSNETIISWLAMICWFLWGAIIGSLCELLPELLHNVSHIGPIYWWRRLTHSGRDKMADIFADDILKCIFWYENVWIWMKISQNFVFKSPINDIPSLVQIMAWCLFRPKPLSEPMIGR